MSMMIRANRNSSIDSLLMPCMYFTKEVFGLSGSGFLIYRYSAICFKTPIVNL